MSRHGELALNVIMSTGNQENADQRQGGVPMSRHGELALTVIMSTGNNQENAAQRQGGVPMSRHGEFALNCDHVHRQPGKRRPTARWGTYVPSW